MFIICDPYISNHQRTTDRRNVIIFKWWYNQQLMKRKGKRFLGYDLHFINIVLCIKLHQDTEKLFIFNLFFSHILHPDCSCPTPLPQVPPTFLLPQIHSPPVSLQKKNRPLRDSNWALHRKLQWDYAQILISWLVTAT